MGNVASGNRDTSVGHIDIYDIPDESPFPSDSHRHGSSRYVTTINESRDDSESPSPARSSRRLVQPSSPSGKKPRGGAHLTLAIEETVAESPPPPKLQAPYSPRNDAQLGGYPPDCGTHEHKYLSYAKVLHERGQTHPMSVSTTQVDAVGNPIPLKYPLTTDFGAHAFHRLPTDSFVLSQYGVGMTLYFKYLKVMTWLFFLLVLLSAPMLLIYTAGGAQSLREFQMLAKQNLPAVLGMTTVGHLKDSSSVCDQVLTNHVLSLACPAGEIGFIKAVYSAHDAQGSCTCPESNKVAEGNGRCRGRPVESCAGTYNNCTRVCPADGFGCFLGVHPVSKWACCATSLDAATQLPSFDGMRIRATSGCDAPSMQTIVNGLCLGKKSCAFNVSEALRYKWKTDATTGATCPSPRFMKGEYCEMAIQDESDFTQCGDDQPLRGLIVYARCFTTRIDLSQEWSLQIIGWDSISRKDFLGLAVGCDIACSVCFFVVVLWMKSKEKENVARINKDQIKALDYTVQLTHVPAHDDVDQLRLDIKTHLETLLSNAPTCARDLDRIRIADIQFGKSTSRHLELLRARGAVVRSLEVAQTRLDKVQLLESRLAPWHFTRKRTHAAKLAAKWERKLQRCNAQLERWQATHQTRAKAITAFITFEEEEGVHRCLTEYPDLGFFYRLFQPRHKRLHGKRLRFRAAPDPTDIVWENLHHPYMERLLRQFIVALVTLAVLFLSFLLILLAKLQKTKLERQFGRPSNCPVGMTKDAVADDERQKLIGLVPYKALVECYCKNVLLEHSYRFMTHVAFVDPVTQATHLYCQTWATSFISTQVLSFISVFMVVCVNVLLARILNTLVAMEKHHTQSGQVVSRITKVFLAQFGNTAILLVIINANLNYFLDDPDAHANCFGLGSLEIFNGKYADFSPAWYADVGVSLMLTMVVNTFSPHVYVVLHYLSLKWKRFRDRGYSRDVTRTTQDTQRDLEVLYRGPKFDLAARYAQSLTSIFITYLFSAGMPLLHFVGFVEMMMTYWADKFTFLRIARSPPLYDAKVATAAGSLLPYAVVLHSLVAMWMFSNEMIFQSPSDILEQLANDDVIVGDGIPSFEVERGQIFGRVLRPQVVVLFGFFVAFGAVLVARAVLFGYFPSLVKSVCPLLTRFTQETKVAKGLPNYFDAMPTSILRDKLTTAMHVKDALRAKYAEALARREEALAAANDRADSPRKSPRRRNRRTISAAEQYLDHKWIVGCPSYAIQDNKDYVEELAIDSYLSDGVPLDRFF